MIRKAMKAVVNDNGILAEKIPRVISFARSIVEKYMLITRHKRTVIRTPRMMILLAYHALRANISETGS
jgi:hypothetical protein